MSTEVTLTVTKTGYVRGDKTSEHFPTVWGDEYILSEKGHSYGYYRMYFGFPALGSSYRYHYISEIRIYLCTKVSYPEEKIAFYSANDFDASTITYNTKPTTSGILGYGAGSSPPWYYNFYDNDTGFYASTTDLGAFLRKTAFAISSLWKSNTDSAPYCKTTLNNGTTKPYIKVILENKNYLIPSYKAGPQSGAYSNPRKSIKFQWQNTPHFDVSKTYAGNLPQSSAVFSWKTSSASTWNTVNVSGAATSVTIPANTFPTASTIQWKVQVTDAGGTSNTTSTFSFSTTAAAMVATPVSPKGSVEENNEPIKFKWNLNSADGFSASRVILQWYKESTTSWETLTDTSSAITSYTAPSGTFPTGTIQWRVRGYNVDGVAGSYSTASFTSIGAPNEPVVDSDQAPFTTINWQASDQEAYDIEIADRHYGPYFGTDKTFTLPDYLEDGEYTAKVRVLGQYGAWSPWGEIALYIENVPSEDISLTAKTFVDAELNWATEEETSDFLIYRNGKQIGHTTRNTFTDRFSNGETEYFVVNRLADGNYSKSEVLQRTVKLDRPYFALLNGGDWVKINYALNGVKDPQHTESIMASYATIAGKRYQTAFMSEFQDETVGYSAVFLYNQNAEMIRFKSLLGKLIIAKFPDGWTGVCVIDSWTVQPNGRYYTAFTFTLKRIEWEDYIDD